MKKYYIILAIIFIACFTACQKNEIKDTTDEKVEALLSKMTLQEKIGQLNQRDAGDVSDEIIQNVKDGNIGSILNCDPEKVNELQRVAIEESRLGIPLLYARDVIHGFKTVFPIPLGQACSWDTTIITEGARVAAAEAASTGIRYTFAPMIDVTRDPRWGRIAESLGEDPYLTSVLGVAMIKGFQGSDMSAPDRVAACAKHFAAYGLTESGRDYNVVFTSEQRLRDYVLPPFEAAAKAGVATFMAGFNELNGVPVSGSTFLLRDILREEWGYKGMVVSDYFSIEQMAVQGFCENEAESAKLGMLAGVDMDMMSFVYVNYLDSLVQANAVDEKLIDDAVRRVLRLKFDLGLFDNPYTDLSKKDSVLYSEEHLKAAVKAATESAVLIKNENDFLPLSADNIKRVAVIGPMADAAHDQMGTWCFDGDKTHSVTPLAAIKQQYGDKFKILYEKALISTRDYDKKNFAKAVSMASKSDVVLLFVGEEAILSGEAKCRADINLPGAQTELLKALEATGKPIVTIVMAGRPLTIEAETEASKSLFVAFHGGTMAGPALIDLIFGKSVPSGKLAVTFPKMVGQIPIYYSDYKTGRPAQQPLHMIDDIPLEAKQTSLGFCTYWLDAGLAPLFPFGYGLSYTKFEYSDLQLSSDKINMTDTLTVSCKIKNTGKYDGTEVVQLYVRDYVGSLVRPLKELKGFQRVYIKKGEEKTVSFKISTDQLSFWNAKMQKLTEPGKFCVWIAPNSVEGLSTDFVLN